MDKMKKFKAIVKRLFGDAAEDETTLQSVIDGIKAQIETLKSGETDETKEEVKAAIAQLSELVGTLQTKLDELKNKTNEPDDKQGDTDENSESASTDLTGKSEEELKAVIAELQKNIVDKDAEIQELKDKIKELEATDDLETTLGDAKSTFGDVAIKGKSAREVKSNVLIDKGILTKSQIEKMGDAALDSSYQALRTNTVIKKRDVKKHSYGDRDTKIDYTQAFGGKKHGK